MLITLVRPPAIVPVGAYIGSLTPPIGLVYLASSLLANGYEVDIIDAVGDAIDQKNHIGDGLISHGLSFEQILSRISPETKIIGFSGMFSSEWVQLKPLLDTICNNFDAYVIAGGEHFTAAPDYCLQSVPKLHAVALGEGEETIVDYARFVAGHIPIEAVNGIVYRGVDGNLRANESRKRIRSIDQIPPPAWNLVNIEEYLSRGLGYGVNRGRSMPMIASRGCPYQCTFCSNPGMWGTRWVARNVDDVINEIVFYKKKYGISNVDFYDLTAIVKKKWILEFCSKLIEREVNITWQLPSGTRSEAIDDEVAPLLYASGCRNMNYAPESGSDYILEKIKKKIKLESMVKSLVAANKAGINVKINIIIGLPMESHKDILKTLFSIVKFSYYGAYDVSIGIFAPYPGSELYAELVADGVITHGDDYWNKLSYVDITKAVSYCKNISANQLLIYNWMGIVLFYTSNYLFRPSRLIKTLKNLKTGRHESRGEMALQQIFNRIKVVIKGGDK